MDKLALGILIFGLLSGLPVWAQGTLPEPAAPNDIKPLHIRWSPSDTSSSPSEDTPPDSLLNRSFIQPARLVIRPADASAWGERAWLPPSNRVNPAPVAGSDAKATDDQEASSQGDSSPSQRFQWGEALRQSALFNSLQHALRFATEDGTRKEIKGPFFRDWFQSVRNLRGWRDGDPFLVNYIGHPIMGAASGYIQIQNDPRGRYLEFEPTKKAYWKSRMKAMAWSAAYSTQFELGPISEASLGNVGRTPRPDGKSPMSYVDLVITPTVGTLWLIGEDALDKHLIQRFENRVRNRFWRGMVRSFLNPGRSIANAMRFKGPWYRDRRPL